MTSNRWILKFTRALGRVQTSVFRRCLIVLHLCTASPRRLGVGVFTACSTPAESQKHFTTRQLNASFHAQEGGICCKPAAFPPAPLCQGVYSLLVIFSTYKWLILEGWFFPSFPSISSPCPYYLWFWRFFFKCYSCCSLEAGRKKAGFLSLPGCRWGFWDLTQRARHGNAADTSRNTQPPSTQAVKLQHCWCWRPAWLIKRETSWGSSRQSHQSVIFSLKHLPTASRCEYLPPDLWMSLQLGKPCRATGRWVWPAIASALSCLPTDTWGIKSGIQIHAATHIFSSLSLYKGQLRRIFENNLVTWEHRSLQKTRGFGLLNFSKSGVGQLWTSNESFIVQTTSKKKIISLSSKPPNSSSSTAC